MQCKTMAKKKNDERNGENVDGEEPNFEDPEGFVDDISDQGASIFTVFWVELGIS